MSRYSTLNEELQQLIHKKHRLYTRRTRPHHCRNIRWSLAIIIQIQIQTLESMDRVQKQTSI